MIRELKELAPNNTMKHDFKTVSVSAAAHYLLEKYKYIKSTPVPKLIISKQLHITQFTCYQHSTIPTKESNA